eukprot:scaffold306817_cov67-Attheya_sp.AAC.4
MAAMWKGKRRDTRWMYCWARNTVERHRYNGQQHGIYIEKTLEDANMTEEELKVIVDDNGDHLRQLVSSRMQKFNSNVTGSEAHFYKKRCELERL